MSLLQSLDREREREGESVTHEWICVDLKSLSVVISDSHPARLPFFCCCFFYGQIKEGFLFFF